MPAHALTFGSFSLDIERRLLTEAGRPVRIGGRALDILVALVARHGEVVAKDELIARAWPGTTVEESALRVHVAALRKALGDGQAGRRFVVNIPGRGYSFVAPLAAAAPAPPPAAPALPPPLTRLVGRDALVRDIAALMPQRRLVTVVGPGGIGKTSVAGAVLPHLASLFADGVVLVDLAPIADPALVPGAVLAALGRRPGSERPGEGLLGSMHGARCLLVLDSCEHVVEAAAHLAEQVLRAAPAAAILATSREALRAEGEWVVRIPPLAVPPPGTPLRAEEALRFPAIELFVERAAACLGGFVLTDAQAPVVAEICRRLDGIALAIELAAGRLDAFGLQELAALLDDRLGVLMRGRRTALPRHQTLRATMDWSYGTLTAEEQAILRRLSIFPGAFPRDAAAAIAATPGEPVAAFEDRLACLVAKSLVATEPTGGTLAYRLLESTRAYAREQLEAQQEAPETARRHALHWQAAFERAEAEWETRPTGEWLAAHAGGLDDLRVALAWAFGPQGDPCLGVALTTAAVPLWFQLSLVDEGVAWVERALATVEADPARDERRRMQLLAALGWTQMYSRDRLERAAQAWRKALELAEALGERDYQQRALWALWADRTNHGEFRIALGMAERFAHVAAAGTATDRLVARRMLGASLHFLGEQAQALAHIDAMIDAYIPPARRSDQVRYQFDQVVTARITRARILWLQGRTDQARHEVATSLERALALDHALTIANVLAQSACPIALLTGDLDAAERHIAMLRRQAAARSLDVWRLYADGYEGELLARRGETAHGLRLLAAAVESLRRASFTQYLTAFLAARAACLIMDGQAEAGRAAVDEALQRCHDTGERWCMPELLRLRALADPGAGPNAADPGQPFADSLRLARAQGAAAWELRTAASCAEALIRHGHADEAVALLAPLARHAILAGDSADTRHATGLIEARVA